MLSYMLMKDKVFNCTPRTLLPAAADTDAVVAAGFVAGAEGVLETWR